MECRILRDERLDVLYGEADVATQKRVEEHLAVCETCREESASFASVRHVLSGHMDLQRWAQMGLIVLVWVIALNAAGILRVRRRGQSGER